MNGQPRFYIHGITAAEWTRRHGVEAFSHPCHDCGRLCTTTIPFAQGTLRGLASPPCACGNEQTPYGLVRDSRYGDLFTGREAVAPARPARRSRKRRTR